MGESSTTPPWLHADDPTVWRVEAHDPQRLLRPSPDASADPFDGTEVFGGAARQLAASFGLTIWSAVGDDTLADGITPYYAWWVLCPAGSHSPDASQPPAAVRAFADAIAHVHPDDLSWTVTFDPSATSDELACQHLNRDNAALIEAIDLAVLPLLTHDLSRPPEAETELVSWSEDGAFGRRTILLWPRRNGHAHLAAGVALTDRVLARDHLRPLAHVLTVGDPALVTSPPVGVTYVADLNDNDTVRRWTARTVGQLASQIARDLPAILQSH